MSTPTPAPATEPKAEPHTVTCVSCDFTFTCYCHQQHTQSLCYYCREGTTPQQAARRLWKYGY